MRRRHRLLAPLVLLLACGPGLEDGTQAGWTCVDALANNFVHVNEGRATLSREQMDELRAGRWYVLISTARHPRGELRGQVIERF